jgi:MoaA/NifB/PqqE/SkfB family radical SAM enzyme
MSQIRTQLSDERSVLADVVPLKMPYSVQVEVSQVCNIRCNYCMHSFIAQKDKGMMDVGLFVDLCDRIEEFGAKLKSVNFAGWGEPLVNPKLAPMIQHLHARKLTESIAVITNGLLLSRANSLNLVAAGANHIRISLQGITEEAYLKVCGKKIYFLDVVNNIRFLYDHKRDCQIYVKVADVALEEGEEEKFYEIFDPISDRMFVEKIRPMFKENENDRRLVSKYGGDHSPVICCPQPFFMISVTATGDLLPCCSYYDPTRFGKISNISMRETWEGKGLRQFREMLLSGNRKAQDDYPVCKNCLMPDAVITPGDELDEKAEEIMRRL